MQQRKPGAAVPSGAAVAGAAVSGAAVAGAAVAGPVVRGRGAAVLGRPVSPAVCGSGARTVPGSGAIVPMGTGTAVTGVVVNTGAVAVAVIGIGNPGNGDAAVMGHAVMGQAVIGIAVKATGCSAGQPAPTIEAKSAVRVCTGRDIDRPRPHQRY